MRFEFCDVFGEMVCRGRIRKTHCLISEKRGFRVGMQAVMIIRFSSVLVGDVSLGKLNCLAVLMYGLDQGSCCGMSVVCVCGREWESERGSSLRIPINDRCKYCELWYQLHSLFSAEFWDWLGLDLLTSEMTVKLRLLYNSNDGSNASSIHLCKNLSPMSSFAKVKKQKTPPTGYQETWENIVQAFLSVSSEHFVK